MSEIFYEVPIDRLDETIEKIFDGIPLDVKEIWLAEASQKVHTILQSRAPFRSGGLRASIVIRPYYKARLAGGRGTIIGPTKKVAGIDLGYMLERGSRGGQTITPTIRRYLKFYWLRTGRWHYAKRVKRGRIKARRWVRGSVDLLTVELQRMAIDRWREELRRGAP